MSLSPQARSWLIRTAQIAVAIAIIALLFNLIDGREALRKLAGAQPLWLMAAFAALTLQTVLSALRWQLTASRLGITFDAGHAIREYYLSQVVNQSLPGGMVGDAGRAVRARNQAGLLRSSQAVIFERLAGQVAMFLMMSCAFLTTWLSPGGLDWPHWVAVTVGLLVAGGLAVIAAVWAGAHLPGAAGRLVTGLHDALDVALLSRSVLPQQAALSFATATCNLAAFAFCAIAIGAPLPLVGIFALVPLILFTMLIPISVSGWGLREGAAAALFPLVGATATQGFAASLAFGLVFIAAVLPGLVPLLRKPAAETPGIQAE